jgi:hypothetical protein
MNCYPSLRKGKLLNRESRDLRSSTRIDRLAEVLAPKLRAEVTHIASADREELAAPDNRRVATAAEAPSPSCSRYLGVWSSGKAFRTCCAIDAAVAVSGHGAVHDPPPIVSEYDEHEQQPECDGQHDEEVAAMIRQA